MFVLFQGGILVIAHRSPRIRDPLYGDRLHLLQKVRNEKKQSNPTLVLMLGSSRTADGFDASRLEQRLEAGFGKPHLVFNYGMVGTGPLVELIYLQRLIKAGIKPNLLLIEVYPLFLTDDGPKPYKARWLKADRFEFDETAIVGRYGIPTDEINACYREMLLNPFRELRWQLMNQLQPSWMPNNVAYYLGTKDRFARLGVALSRHQNRGTTAEKYRSYKDRDW